MSRGDQGSDVTVLGTGKHIRLVRRCGWEFVERPRVRGIAVMVAVTPARELLLVEQYREPVGAPVIELPAGLVGDEPGREGETLDAAATRELREETGWEAGGWERLSAGPPTAGLSGEVVTLLRARDLVHGGGDVEEGITVHAVELGQVAAWLEEREADGRLVDPKVWAGVFFALRRAPISG